MSIGTKHKDNEKVNKPFPFEVSVMAMWTKSNIDCICQWGVLYPSACIFWIWNCNVCFDIYQGEKLVKEALSYMTDTCKKRQKCSAWMCKA